MQAAAEEPKPVGLVLDGEMRGDAHDLLAFVTAFALSTLEKPEAKVLTLSLTGSPLEGAAFTEAVARFYAIEALRAFPERFQRYRGLPVGLDEGGAGATLSPAVKAVLSKQSEDGEPLYDHEIHAFTDTADPAALIRNGLTAQEDQSSAVVLNGPATNLVRVLGLNGGRELIEAKVKHLVASLGDPKSGKPDAHLKADVDAARRLLAEWPTPVYVVGASLGKEAPFPGDRLAAGVNWSDRHPAVDLFRGVDESARRAAVREAAAVLFAVRPEQEYLTASEPGEFTVDTAGALQFKPSPSGRHRLLTSTPAQGEELNQVLEELAVRQPAAREIPEFLKRFIEEQKKEDEAKDSE